jgi:hypothetical protein
MSRRQGGDAGGAETTTLTPGMNRLRQRIYVLIVALVLVTVVDFGPVRRPLSQKAP